MSETATRWIVGLALALCIVALNTFVLVVLWGWFVVPFGLPQIGFAWAFGLLCVASLFSPTVPPAPDGKVFEHLRDILMKPVLVLAFGGIAKLFM